MEVLYWLEGIRSPFLDTFFSLITHLGSETLFLAIAIIVFWYFSKTKGYYLMTVGFFGTLINQFLKLLCRIPRPWVKDPNFTIVEAAREEATGYSFPSGHTLAATMHYGKSTAETASGSCGRNAVWTLKENGTLTISGSGAIYNYDFSDNESPWYNKFHGMIEKVVVEEVSQIWALMPSIIVIILLLFSCRMA